MDKLTQAIPSLGRIDLAREPDFVLGAARVRPPRCEVEGAGGVRQVLQRRVMQVLVALARSPNDVVSQPELISRCWGGLTVSEDAIGRCIGQLRKLAAAFAEPPFAIETLPGIGYRLDVGERRSEAGAGPALEPLLAVLAFDNLSADLETQFFSDGVSEEILDTVARGSGVKVIAPSSSFQFRGPEKAVRRVAAALKATHLLDGSVRRAGSRIRIAAHLVDCASETTIWSDRFERELVDVFALQDEIAGAVAGALNAVLAPTPKPAVIRPETYEAYLQAQPMVYVELHYVDRAAVDLLERVVAEAPTFAAAWENLAVARAKWLRSGGAAQPFDEARAAVVGAAETALRLDPSRGRAHLALALLEPWAAYARREAHLDRAVATNINDAVLIMSRARQLGYVGRGRAALEEARRAVSLDPVPPLNKVAITSGLSQLGRYQEVLEIWDEWVGNPLRGNLSPALAQTAALRDWARHDAYLALLAPGRRTV
jgi:TolB-like protein